MRNSPDKLPKLDALSMVYLDTNVLWKSQWPHVSTALENLFILCIAARIQVCLPEAVELEIEQRNVRELDKAVAKFKDELSQLPDVIQRGTNVEYRSPDLNEFRKLTDKNLAKYRVERVPLTSQTLRDFFELAIRHTAPFANKGSGFQDSVILHSVLEHFMPLNISNGGKLNSVITTEDGQFIAGINSSGAGRLRGVKFGELLLRLEEASPLATAINHRWDSETKSAAKSLEQMTREIEQFVTVKYFSGFSKIGMLSGRQFESVHIHRITGVTVPIHDSRDAAGTKNVVFSFKVELEVESTTAQVPSRFDMELLDFPRSFTAERITLEIEANAKVENGEYKDIRFLGARRP